MRLKLVAAVATLVLIELPYFPVASGSVGARVHGAHPLNFPAAAHIWGGNSAQAYPLADVVITNRASDGSHRRALATARLANPGVLAFLAPGISPKQTWQFTYGDGLAAWRGVNDAASPNPQGKIRAFRRRDFGCTQADGLRGFNLARASTADLVKRASFYGWKRSKAAALGFNGIWSDNLIPGNLIKSGWFYGSACTLSTSAWDAGLIAIANGLRSLTGGAMIGGNGSYRANSLAVRAATDMSMLERLEITVGQGPSAFAATLAEIQAWQAASNGSGNPKILVVMDYVPQAETQRMRYGLALATILGGAYDPYQSHSDLYFPAEMYRNGQRGYLGQPTGSAIQVGASAWKRTFEHGTVYANMGSSTVEIDGITVPPDDGVFVST